MKLIMRYLSEIEIVPIELVGSKWVKFIKKVFFINCPENKKALRPFLRVFEHSSYSYRDRDDFLFRFFPEKFFKIGQAQI